MENFTFYMPTKIIYGNECVKKNKGLFANLGKKAFIITYNLPGKHYSLEHVKEILDETKIEYIIDTRVEENPSMRNIEDLAEVGRRNNIDFVIGIGGGSPIDAAKSVGTLIKNPDKSASDLFICESLRSLPIIAIPTTAGTGAEVTHWAVLTRNDIGTKQAICPRIFPKYAFIDASYLMETPVKLSRTTAIDALCHNIESYVSTESSFLTRALCETGFKLFSECIDFMKADNYKYEIREKLMLVSLIGGIVNAQTGSCLAHGMSYALTHYKRVPHGLACGLLIKEYLGIFKNKEKINRIMMLCGFDNINSFGMFIDSMLNLNVTITEDELEMYTNEFTEQKHRLKRHPEPIGKFEILQIYKNSLLK